MITKYLILILCFFAALTMHAQTVHHFNVWNKISVTQPINKQFKTELDFQYRTQNNFFGDNTPFDEGLMRSLRLTVMYQLNKNITFNLSPYGYFSNNSIIVQRNDINKPVTHEVRFLAGLEIQSELSNRWLLFNKTGIEYRDFNQMANSIRFRHKISLRYNFNDKFSAFIYEEPLLNLTGTPKNHLFDHNRLALVGSFKPTKHWRIETGYIHINRLPRNSLATLEEEDIMLNLYYTLNSLKKHKS